MSTHYIEEAERLADTVVVVANGQAVAVGRPSDLVAEHAGAEALEVYGPPARLREVEPNAFADFVLTDLPDGRQIASSALVTEG